MSSSSFDASAGPRAATTATGNERAETEPGTAGAPGRSLPRRVVPIVLSLGLGVAVLLFVLPQVADFSKVWAEIRAMTGLEVSVLAVAAIWNLITYWIVTVIATPGLSYPQAAVVTETTTAVANTVPAGGAVAVGLNFAMLSSWGFSKSRTTLSVVVTGLWNNFAKLAMPIMALAILALQGETSGGKIFAAVAGMVVLVATVVMFALILRSEQFAARAALAAGRFVSGVRRLLHRGSVSGWDIAVVKFRGRVIGLVRRRWVALSVSTLVGHLSLYAVLLIALREVGVAENEVGWAQVLAVFAFARLLTAIPITPGGIGVIELALIAGLNAAGGQHAQVVAAVLVFRVLTYVLPIPLGLITYVFWRRNTSWHDSAPPLAERFSSV